MKPCPLPPTPIGRALAAGRGLRSAGAYQRSRQPLWPVWRPHRGTMMTGIATRWALPAISKWEIDIMEEREGFSQSQLAQLVVTITVSCFSLCLCGSQAYFYFRVGCL